MEILFRVSFPDTEGKECLTGDRIIVLSYVDSTIVLSHVDGIIFLSHNLPVEGNACLDDEQCLAVQTRFWSAWAFPTAPSASFSRLGTLKGDGLS